MGRTMAHRLSQHRPPLAHEFLPLDPSRPLNQLERLFVPVSAFQQLHGCASVHLGVRTSGTYTPLGLQLHRFEVVFQGRFGVTSVRVVAGGRGGQTMVKSVVRWDQSTTCSSLLVNSKINSKKKKNIGMAGPAYPMV